MRPAALDAVGANSQYTLVRRAGALSNTAKHILAQEIGKARSCYLQILDGLSHLQVDINEFGLRSANFGVVASTLNCVRPNLGRVHQHVGWVSIDFGPRPIWGWFPRFDGWLWPKLGWSRPSSKCHLESANFGIVQPISGSPRPRAKCGLVLRRVGFVRFALRVLACLFRKLLIVAARHTEGTGSCQNL